MLTSFLYFVLAHMFRIIGDMAVIILSPLIFIYQSYTRNKFSQSKKFNSILITGGSSGIGKAIALELVKENPDCRIIITGTNKRRLDSAKTALKTASGNSNSIVIIAEQLNVCDKDGMKQFIQKMDDEYKLDLLIANAGTEPSMLNNPHYFESCEKILDINVNGVFNTILPIIPRMQERKSGHIAITGSIAGYMPTCRGSHYSATKAYLRYFCDDIRPKLKSVGNVDITYIAPGYVESRMNPKEMSQDKFGIISSEAAAKYVVNGLKSNEAVIAFPEKTLTLGFLIASMHPYLNAIVSDRFLFDQHKAVQHVGFYHEIDPNDEFGGEC